MHKPTLFAVVAATAAALLIAPERGQVASTSFQSEPAYVERDYGLDGLFLPASESKRLPEAAPLDIEAMASGQSELVPGGCWPLGTGAPEPVGRGTEEFRMLIESLDAGDELESVHLDTKPILRLRCSATEAMHERIAWAMQALRQFNEARIQIEVIEVRSRPSQVVLSAAEVQALKGKQIWTASLWQGQAGIASTLEEKRVPYNIEYSSGGESRATGTFFSGAQWRVTAACMPGGLVRIQAAVSRGKDVEIRPCTLPEGSLELPSMTWSFVPSCGTVSNGGGMVLDGGDRFFVVRATSTTELQHLDREGVYRICNPAGAAPAQDQVARWLLPPEEGAPVGREFRCLPQRSDRAHNAWLQQGDGLGTFGSQYARELVQSMGADFRFAALGPVLLCVELPHDPASAEAAWMAEEKLYLRQELGRRFAERPFTKVGVVAVVIPDGSKLPPGVVNGRPVGQDIETLQTLPGVQVLLDRRAAIEVNQTIDLLDVRLRNHVAAHMAYSTSPDKVRWQPEVHTASSGWQMRLYRGADQRLTARLGVRQTLPLKEFAGTGDAKGRAFEAQEGSYTEALLDVLATAPGWHSIVRPLDGKRQLVLCLENIKP